MKKVILLGAAIFGLSSLPAYAGSSFHIGFFSPAPVYVAPQPAYVVEPYPVTYAYSYPRYSYVTYDGWERKQCRRNHNRWHNRHDWDDNRNDWRGHDHRGRW